MKYLVLLLSLFYIFSAPAFAASSYILPYPPSMPGSPTYKLRQLYETLDGYWHFGSISQFKYHQKLADKYLVQAKVLFEYGQYRLAVDALEESNIHFAKLNDLLSNAKNEGKDISVLKSTYSNEVDKHREVLSSIQNITPQKVVWQEENEGAEKLNLHNLLDASIDARR